MVKATKVITAADEVIMNKIYMIRGQKVMIDRDLAALYEVETKRLKETVRRNPNRFPKDFMFEMSKKEFENWRTQHAASNEDKQGLRYAPFCFTERGVTMLSCILNSDRAIDVNLQIIRIFTRMKELLLTNKDILLKMQNVEHKLIPIRHQNCSIYVVMSTKETSAQQHYYCPTDPSFVGMTAKF